MVGHMTPIEAPGEVNGHLAALVRRHLVGARRRYRRR